MDELLEDFEAMNSTELKRRVKLARQGLKKGEYVTVKELAQEYGL